MLKNRCTPIIHQKKQFNELLQNPNAPPPQFKMVDVITQVEKMNKELGENEIKFRFSFPDKMIDTQRIWVEYVLQLEDGGPKVEGIIE